MLLAQIAQKWLFFAHNSLTKKVDQLKFLKNQLTRKASDSLAGLGITNENCDIAVEMLKEHYKKHPFVRFTMKQKTHLSIKITWARCQLQTLFDYVTVKTLVISIGKT